MNCLFGFCLALSVAMGGDIGHDTGKGYAEMRLSGLHWSAYVATDSTIGGDATVGTRVRFGVGVEYADSKRLPLVRSGLAYALRLEGRLSDKWSIGIKHRSNCSDICRGVLKPLALGREDKPNAGYNFLYLRRSF
jgi:hypothetical protein